jgi:hypothetical protein
VGAEGKHPMRCGQWTSRAGGDWERLGGVNLDFGGSAACYYNQKNQDLVEWMLKLESLDDFHFERSRLALAQARNFD